MYFFIFISCVNTIASMINTNPFFDFASGIRGAVGRLDTSQINFSELQTAIKRCSHSALKTVQAKSLLRIAQALYDVRHAVSQNDWPR